jgi:hypothetical protein
MSPGPKVETQNGKAKRRGFNPKSKIQNGKVVATFSSFLTVGIFSIRQTPRETPRSIKKRLTVATCYYLLVANRKPAAEKSNNRG